MLEIAAILTQTTERLLVILDEVGWDTSTHDGLAIAQATTEQLHDVVALIDAAAEPAKKRGLYKPRHPEAA